MDKFSHATNYQFFFYFFDRFDKVNSSVCFNNFVGKPQFGPYDLEIIHILQLNFIDFDEIKFRISINFSFNQSH